MINSFLKKISLLFISLFISLFIFCFISYSFLNNSWNIIFRSHYSEKTDLTSTYNNFILPQSDVSYKNIVLRKNAPSLLSYILSPGSLLYFWGKDELSKQCLKPLVLQEKLLSILQPKGLEFERHPDFENQVQSLTYVGLAPQSPGQTVLSTRSRGNRKPLQPRALHLKKSQHPRFCFPVSHPFSFRDTWGDLREGDRYHKGVDIFAREGTEVYAITDGVVHKLVTWNGAGHTLLLRGRDGKGYCYMHLQEYAEGITEGKVVKQGDLIAYVGRSGLSSSPAHLHFQVHADHHFTSNEIINPYDFLVSLCQGRGVADLGLKKTFSSKFIERRQIVRYREGPRPEYFMVIKKPLITWLKPHKSIQPANWAPQPKLHPRQKIITVLEGR